MLEILTLYVSSFWVWLGITIALSLIVDGIVKIFAVLIAGLTNNLK
jgi:hypothetical protein